LDRSLKLFRADTVGTLVARPNRFTFLVDLSGKASEVREIGEIGVTDETADRVASATVRVHVPNPGRMWELTYPGTEVILEHAGGPLPASGPEPGDGRAVAGGSRDDGAIGAARPARRGASGGRTTEWTAVAVRRPSDGVVVPLVAAGANRVARELILPDLLPDATEIRSEVTRGASRFDFVASTPDGDVVVEVKSCTLAAHGVAMFPDAATARGARHVAELAAIPGGRRIVLFVVQGPPTDLFVPDIHTDPDFAVALRDAARKGVEVVAVATQTTPDGMTTVTNRSVPIDLGVVDVVDTDRGSYVVHLRIDSPRDVAVGALGSFTVAAGHYLYVGSAMGTMRSRTARHERTRKRMRWHIDYLRAAADWAHVYRIYAETRLECHVAGVLGDIYTVPIPGFGSSDCSCTSHLFYAATDPRGDPRFVEAMLTFRHRDALAPISRRKNR
jgi:sugar fermentation stimulation protein A